MSVGLADKFGPEVGSGRRRRRGTDSASPVKRFDFVVIISLPGLIVSPVKEV